MGVLARVLGVRSHAIRVTPVSMRTATMQYVRAYVGIRMHERVYVRTCVNMFVRVLFCRVAHLLAKIQVSHMPL